MFKSKIQDFETKFEQLDMEKISTELKVEQLSKEMASNEAPPADAIYLDHNENKIIVYIENKVEKANNFVHDKLLVFNKVMTNTQNAINNLEGLNYIHNKFEDEYNHLFTQSKDDIQSLKETMIERKKDLGNFKIKHKLDRQENSPSSILFHVSLILLIVIGESFFNAFFFSKGNDLGLLGGLFQSITVSVINLFIAWFTIILWRKSRDITYTSLNRNIFILIVACIVLFVIGFHLLVGHYRDALNINPEEAYLISIQSYMTNPFVLTDFNSWILVILGVFFFTIQLIDIYKMKDPYPGYTEITRNYEKSKIEYEGFKYDVLEKAKGVEEKVYKDISLIIKKANLTYSEVETIPDIKKRLESKYQEHIMHLTNLLNLLINQYRSINKSFRKTDAPQYFNDNKVELSTPRIKFSYVQDKKNVNKLNKLISTLAHLEAETLENVKTVSKKLKDESELLNEI